jgi:hypothetical protein
MICRVVKMIVAVSCYLILMFVLGPFCIAQNDSFRKQVDVGISVTYCDLPLSTGWKLGNLTFNSLYSFDIDEKGKPINLRKIRDDFVGIKAVQACMSNWRITGVSRTKPFAVYFNWKHGEGWIEQRISGDGFTHVMKIEGVGIERGPNRSPR